MLQSGLKMTKNVKASHKRPPKRNSLFSKLPNFNAVLFGFLLGVFTSSLTVFMFSTSDITLKLPTIGKKPQTIAAATPTTMVQEPRFEFYTELAKTEPIIAPTQETAAMPSKAFDLKSSKKTINGYIVQAGTYRRAADADAVKATLTLNGFAAKIENTKQNGELLHRVLLGTYKNEHHAKALQQKLKALNIESSLVLKYTE